MKKIELTIRTKGELITLKSALVYHMTGLRGCEGYNRCSRFLDEIEKQASALLAELEAEQLTVD